MSGGWGLTPWGSGGWGGGVAAVAVLRAVPIRRRTVRVYFAASVRAVTDIGSGDALNPDLWTLADVTQARALSVALVEVYTATDVLDVHTIEPLSPYPNVHRLTFATVRDATGALLQAPRQIDFRGLGLAPGRTRGAPHDLLNRPALGSDDLLGSLVVSSAHDYEPEVGVELTKKLILRRLTSSPDAYMHLGEGYGAGLRLKEPVRNVTRFRARVKAQVLLEPSVAEASVSVELAPTGVLTIRIAARTRSGAGFELELEATT